MSYDFYDHARSYVIDWKIRVEGLVVVLKGALNTDSKWYGLEMKFLKDGMHVSRLLEIDDAHCMGGWMAKVCDNLIDSVSKGGFERINDSAYLDFGSRPRQGFSR